MDARDVETYLIM